jgi:hypothetical protein
MQRRRPSRRTKSSRDAASILGVAGGRPEGAKFSYPQTLEKARNGEGISFSLLAPNRAGVSIARFQL